MDRNARGRWNLSQNCSLYILDNYYISTDKMIQNLLDYYSFTKDRIFEYLLSIFNRKLHYQNTYSRALRELSMEVENKARQIHRFGESRRHALQLTSAYEHVFLSLRQELITEMKLIQSKQESHEQTYIYILQSCKLSHIENQKDFIQHAQKQLSEEAGKIGQKVRQIQNNQNQADSLKFEIFGEMLLILKQFDQEMIRQKYQLQQSEKNFKYLDSKRSQMNQKLDQISAIEQDIKQNIKQIRLIQKQRQQFCEKVCEKLDKIQIDKLLCLQKICQTFKQQFKPLSTQITYKNLIDLRLMDIPFTSNKQFLDNYKKSLYLLLNPHPQNKLLIDHRESLATKLSLSSLKQNRKAQTFETLSLNFQVQDNKDAQKYNDDVEFVYRIRSTIASSYLTDEEIDAFFQYFHANMRKKPIREVFLFYLYELGKTESRLIGLVCKEVKLLVRMLGIFFKECLNLYDSQSAIKALMLIYHIQLPDSPSIHLSMRDQPIWKSFQFWETSFLESLYEYFEMVVIYYHNLVEKHSQKSQTNHNNWFVNIFNIFPKTQEKKKMSPQEALREFYHQIFRNLTIIYLANMIMMHVPHVFVDKFKKYISEGVTRLNWAPQYSDNLESFMRSVCSKSQKSIKRLLTNDNILERVMSKLIGSQEQEKKESVSLSKSIREWLSSDR